MKGWAKGEEKGTDLVVEKAVAAMNAVRAAFNNGSLNPTQIVATMRDNVIANQSRLIVPKSVISAASERGKTTTVIEKHMLRCNDNGNQTLHIPAYAREVDERHHGRTKTACH